MAREREIRVTVLGDSKGAQHALAQLDDHADRVGNRFDGLGSKLVSFGKVAALGLGAAAVGVGLFLKKSVEAAEESRKVMAQTEAVIKSTGGAANVSASQVGAYSDKLAALTGIDDEVISGGQNMLLTFTRVRNEVGAGNDIFNQATKASLNMSVALGKDLPSSAMLVGKALNDPIAGMTALTRSGIQFTDQQKEQVKAMVAAGDQLGAQKIILKELEVQFGGSAEAAASPMERLKVVVGNLQEELGARFLPIVAQVATFLADKLPGAIDTVTGLFTGLFNIFANRDFTGEFGRALGVEEDSPLVAKVFAFRDAVVAGFEFVVAWVRENWPQIRDTVTEVLETVNTIITGFVDFVSTLWANFGDQIVTYTRNAFDAAVEIIGGALDMIQGIVNTVTAIIHGDWSGAWEGIKQILGGAFDAMVGLAHQWDNVMRSLMSVAMEALGSIISSAFEGIVNFVSSMPDRIYGALGDLSGLLYGAGQDLIWGMLQGILSMAGRLANAVLDVVKGAVNAGKRFLGIGSPSKLFMGFGVNVGEGFVRGLGQSEDSVSRAGESLAAASVPGGLSGAGGGGAGGTSGFSLTVNVGTVAGTDGMRELTEMIRTQLLQMQRRVPSLGFT